MKKLIIIAIAFLAISANTYVESIYNISIPSIEGQTQSISVHQGKRIFIITLPITQNAANNAMLHSLDSLRNIYQNNTVFIGVPAIEDGYTPAIKAQLNTWYRTKLNSAIIITDGLYTRKGSALQHQLFQWLTDEQKNGHFDEDVTGVGNKFVVWTDGELKAVFKPTTRLSGASVNAALEN
jgi:glutathione peroxidase